MCVSSVGLDSPDLLPTVHLAEIRQLYSIHHLTAGLHTQPEQGPGPGLTQGGGDVADRDLESSIV